MPRVPKAGSSQRHQSEHNTQDASPRKARTRRTTTGNINASTDGGLSSRRQGKQKVIAPSLHAQPESSVASVAPAVSHSDSTQDGKAATTSSQPPIHDAEPPIATSFRVTRSRFAGGSHHRLSNPPESARLQLPSGLEDHQLSVWKFVDNQYIPSGDHVMNVPETLRVWHSVLERFRKPEQEIFNALQNSRNLSASQTKEHLDSIRTSSPELVLVQDTVGYGATHSRYRDYIFLSTQLSATFETAIDTPIKPNKTCLELFLAITLAHEVVHWMARKVDAGFVTPPKEDKRGTASLENNKEPDAGRMFETHLFSGELRLMQNYNQRSYIVARPCDCLALGMTSTKSPILTVISMSDVIQRLQGPWSPINRSK